jgi:hypothetical protein
MNIKEGETRVKFKECDAASSCVMLGMADVIVVITVRLLFQKSVADGRPNYDSEKVQILHFVPTQSTRYFRKKSCQSN